MDSDDSINGTPLKMQESATFATLDLLPGKSKERYKLCYRAFLNWRKNQKATSFSEPLLLAYFAHLSKKKKPSTLWNNYSMLRTTINVNNNVDIGAYQKLKSCLKRQSDNFTPKKHRTLTSEDINRFLQHAPDSKYLLVKVN